LLIHSFRFASSAIRPQINPRSQSLSQTAVPTRPKCKEKICESFCSFVSHHSVFFILDRPD
jgi:hypothetical protein